MYKVDHEESASGTYLRGTVIALDEELFVLFGEPVDTKEGSTKHWTFVGTEEGHDDELEIFTIYNGFNVKKFMWNVGAKTSHTDFISWVIEQLEEMREGEE